jgi:hypothetical protein
LVDLPPLPAGSLETLAEKRRGSDSLVDPTLTKKNKPTPLELQGEKRRGSDSLVDPTLTKQLKLTPAMTYSHSLPAITGAQRRPAIEPPPEQLAIEGKKPRITRAIDYMGPVNAITSAGHKDRAIVKRDTSYSHLLSGNTLQVEPFDFTQSTPNLAGASAIGWDPRGFKRKRSSGSDIVRPSFIELPDSPVVRPWKRTAPGGESLDMGNGHPYVPPVSQPVLGYPELPLMIELGGRA